MAVLFYLPNAAPVASGRTYPGARLFFYESGTSTPAVVYSDELVTARTQPVVADSSGVFPPIYLDPAQAYRVVLQTSEGVTLRDVDPIPAAQSAEIDVGESLWPQTSKESGVTIADYSYPPGNVLRYGADPTGVATSSAAFASAWSVIKTTGGEIIIPPGSYLLNSTWTLDVDLTAPHHYKVSGYGATLFAASSVTGHAIRVYKGYNNFGVVIEGLHFNHRGNSTVAGCIEGQGASNLRIVRCSVEGHNTKAGYAAVKLGPYTPGNPDTNTFWALVDGFTTRQRSGGDGTNMAVGVLLAGQANAAKIVNCSFGNVVDAIRFQTDGVYQSYANSTRILHNDFEGVTNCITVDTSSPADYMPSGTRIAFNRVESATTFVNITNAATLNEPNVTMSAFCNDLIVGSVTNYLVNPNDQYFFSYEPSYSGVGVRNYLGGPADFRVVLEGEGHNLVLGGFAQTQSYQSGHIVLGGYHLWVENATGLLRISSTAPTADNDGDVVGEQAGA